MIDLAIVGNGPAGCSTAVYAGNAGVEHIVIFSGPEPGGQLTKTDTVPNFLGFTDISGHELTEKFVEHASKYATIVNDIIDHIEEHEGFFLLIGRQSVYKAKFLMIATGSSPKKLEIPSIITLENRGVSYCYICDGFLYRDKIVTIVGGGNSALEGAIYLANIAKKVYVVHRREEFSAFDVIQQNVKKLIEQGKIELVLNSQVVRVESNEKGVLNSIHTQNLLHKDRQILTDGLFINIGHRPRTGFLGNLVKLSSGYVLVDKNQQSSHPRIFAAGDCCVFSDNSRKFLQAICAASEGCVAGLVIAELSRTLKTA